MRRVGPATACTADLRESSALWPTNNSYESTTLSRRRRYMYDIVSKSNKWQRERERKSSWQKNVQIQHSPQNSTIAA